MFLSVCVIGLISSVAVSFLDGAVHLPLGIALGGSFPLIVVLFTLAQADLQLHPGVLDPEGTRSGV